MEYALISLGSFVGYVISTIGGGGASLLMVPVVSFLLGPKAIAPVIAIGEELSRPVRLVLFWRDINWSVAKFHVPGSMVGAFIGAYFFTQIDVAWLQIILGLFLISTVFQYQFGQKKRTFRMEALYFLPLGFFVSMGSALFGATGPVENPFYLNYGLEKEKMVATKTINSFMAGLVQLGTYSYFWSAAIRAVVLWHRPRDRRRAWQLCRQVAAGQDGQQDFPAGRASGDGGQRGGDDLSPSDRIDLGYSKAGISTSRPPTSTRWCGSQAMPNKLT